MEQEQQPRYRIRKLTPRECFRLMDVRDTDIDKIQAAADTNGKPLISKSQQYKLAGNSIVVANLVHIFRNLFSGEPSQPLQLSLFDNPTDR